MRGLAWRVVWHRVQQAWCAFWRTAKAHPGYSISITLHLVLFFLLLFGLPFAPKEHAKAPMPVQVQMTPLPQKVEPPKKEVKKAPPKSPVKQVVSKPKPPPPPKKVPKPAPKKAPEPAPAKVTPKDVKKKLVPKPQKEPAPAPSFDDVLKTVEDLKKNSSPQEVAPPAPVPTTLAPYLVRSIRGQISRHWAVPAGVMEAENMVIELRLSLARDGTVTRVTIVDQARYQKPKESAFRAAADSALRAARQASPLQDLPLKQYDMWKELELSFNPKTLLQ